jgi:hypothetical protein
MVCRPTQLHQLDPNLSDTVLRGDIARLERCTAITTGADLAPVVVDGVKGLPRTIKRSKPFKYTYEKEIVMYAYFKVSSPSPSLRIRRLMDVATIETGLSLDGMYLQSNSLPRACTSVGQGPGGCSTQCNRRHRSSSSPNPSSRY